MLTKEQLELAGNIKFEEHVALSTVHELLKHIAELEQRLAAAEQARREAQIAQQEAIEARNRVGVEIRRELGHKLTEAEAERDHWKANHKKQVEHTRTLVERPDLLVKRVQAHQHMSSLEKDAMRHRFILNACTVILPDGTECEDVQQLDDAINTY